MRSTLGSAHELRTAIAYGVLGVGALASAIVTGLCEGVADPPAIVLSPRNADTAADLAARFESVSVAADNQAVVDAAGAGLRHPPARPRRRARRADAGGPSRSW